MRIVSRIMAVAALFAGQAAVAAEPTQTLTVDERIRLAEAMQKCWKNDSVSLVDTNWKGGASLKADVDGTFKKVVAIAGDAKLTSDFRNVVRSEFAAFSDSNAALIIRSCYKGLFGAELDPSASHPSKSSPKKPVKPQTHKEPSEAQSSAATPPVKSTEEKERIEQSIDTEGHVKAGDMKAVSTGAPIKQKIKGGANSIVEVGEISAEQK